MVIVCKDFEFDGKTLISQNYSSLNFDDDTTLPSSIVREMDSSTMNTYRNENNGLGIKYTDTLIFDLHIAKSFVHPKYWFHKFSQYKKMVNYK